MMSTIKSDRGEKMHITKSTHYNFPFLAGCVDKKAFSLYRVIHVYSDLQNITSTLHQQIFKTDLYRKDKDVWGHQSQVWKVSVEEVVRKMDGLRKELEDFMAS